VKLRKPTLKTISKFTERMKVQDRTLTNLFNSIGRDTTSRIMKQIRRWDGKSVSELTTSVRGTRVNKFSDGLFKKTRSQIEATVRSAEAQVINQASEAFFEENPHLVKAVQLTAVLDSRTTPICRSYDGRVYPIGKGPRPPFHFNCRTTVVPVLRSWEELGIKNPTKEVKSQFTGTPADRVTYNEWLMRQKAEIQDKALGPKRAALLRSGQVSIDSFTNNRGRLLTLKELARREGLTLDF
jgi:SPP1 gp7 family putative phage head morphogenesis protein